MVFPANGQTNLDTTTLTFIWKKSADPDGDPITYSLFYCDNPNFSNCAPTTVASITSFKDKGVFYAGMGVNWAVLLISVLLFSRLKGRKGLGAGLLIVLLIAGGMSLSACGSGGSSETAFSPAPPAQPDPGDDEVGYSVTGLSSGTTYYWKVAVMDDKGGSTESDVWSFTTQ